MRCCPLPRHPASPPRRTPASCSCGSSRYPPPAPPNLVQMPEERAILPQLQLFLSDVGHCSAAADADLPLHACSLLSVQKHPCPFPFYGIIGQRAKNVAVPPLVRRPLTGSGLVKSPTGPLRCIGRPRRSLLALFQRFRSAAQGCIHAAALSPFHQPGALLAGLCRATRSRHRVIEG